MSIESKSLWENGWLCDARTVPSPNFGPRPDNTAITLASNIVKREVKPEDHDRLVSDALGQFSKLN